MFTSVCGVEKDRVHVLVCVRGLICACVCAEPVFCLASSSWYVLPDSDYDDRGLAFHEALKEHLDFLAVQPPGAHFK